MAGRARLGRTLARAVRALRVALLAFALSHAAAALALAQGQLKWVEVALALDADGQARVTYQVRYGTSGTMHGFYFEGEAAEPRFRGGTAELPGGEQVPLSITRVDGSKWDVVLAGGRAWGPGEATYTLLVRCRPRRGRPRRRSTRGRRRHVARRSSTGRPSSGTTRSSTRRSR